MLDKTRLIREGYMASEQSVKDALTSVVASIESLMADIKGNEAKTNQLTPETRALVKEIQKRLTAVKSELLDYMSPKTVQTTLQFEWFKLKVTTSTLQYKRRALNN